MLNLNKCFQTHLLARHISFQDQIESPSATNQQENILQNIHNKIQDKNTGVMEIAQKIGTSRDVTQQDWDQLSTALDQLTDGLFDKLKQDLQNIEGLNPQQRADLRYSIIQLRSKINYVRAILDGKIEATRAAPDLNLIDQKTAEKITEQVNQKLNQFDKILQSGTVQHGKITEKTLGIRPNSLLQEETASNETVRTVKAARKDVITNDTLQKPFQENENEPPVTEFQFGKELYVTPQNSLSIYQNNRVIGNLGRGEKITVISQETSGFIKVLFNYNQKVQTGWIRSKKDFFTEQKPRLQYPEKNHLRESYHSTLSELHPNDKIYARQEINFFEQGKEGKFWKIFPGTEMTLQNTQLQQVDNEEHGPTPWLNVSIKINGKETTGLIPLFIGRLTSQQLGNNKEPEINADLTNNNRQAANERKKK